MAVFCRPFPYQASVLRAAAHAMLTYLMRSVHGHTCQIGRKGRCYFFQKRWYYTIISYSDSWMISTMIPKRKIFTGNIFLFLLPKNDSPKSIQKVLNIIFHRGVIISKTDCLIKIFRHINTVSQSQKVKLHPPPDIKNSVVTPLNIPKYSITLHSTNQTIWFNWKIALHQKNAIEWQSQG